MNFTTFITSVLAFFAVVALCDAQVAHAIAFIVAALILLVLSALADGKETL